MLIVAECPVCGFKGNVPDQFKGRKVKCRECCNMFVVGGESAAAAAGAAVKRKSNPEVGGLDFLGDGGAGSGADTPSPFAEFDNPAPEPPRPTRKSSPGTAKPDAEDRPATRKPAAKRAFKKKADQQPLPIAAVVLGVLGLVLGLAGLIVRNKGLAGLASVPLSGLGLCLAVGGLFPAFRRPAIGLPAPVLGLIVCLIALPLGGMETYNLIASGVLSEESPVAKKTEPAAPTNPATSEPNPTPVGQPQPVPVSTPYAAPGTPDGQWAEPTRGIRLGNVQVKVTKVEVDFVRGKDGAANVSKEKHLLVRLEISNTGNQDIDYFGWAGAEPRPGGEPPALTDDTGNAIRRIVYDKGQVEGQVDSKTIQPGKTLTDLMIFQVPPDSIKYLRLELSAANLDGTGKLRFQIPKVMLASRVQPGPPPKDRPPLIPPVQPPPPPPPIPKGGPRRVEELRKDLKKMAAPDRISAALELGNRGAAAAPAVPDLIVGLRDRNGEMRRTCAEALGKVGPAGRTAIPALIGLLRDEFWRVQAAAARSLGQMGPAAKAAIPELTRLTQSKDEEVPDRAKEALKKIGAMAPVR